MIRFKVVIFPLLILFALMLSGCAIIGQDDPEPGQESAVEPGSATVFGNQATLGGNATLICTQACSDLGFCGNDPNGNRVVLLNSFGPATKNHDLFMPANLPVTIFGVEKQDAMVISSGDRFAVDYYLINAAENGQGWVAGWCIGQ